MSRKLPGGAGPLAALEWACGTPYTLKIAADVAGSVTAGDAEREGERGGDMLVLVMA